MATDPPETGSRSSGEDPSPETGEGIGDLDSPHSTKVLRREIDARDLNCGARGCRGQREEELRGESTRQAAYFEESLNRLRREMQEQSMESAERVRELKAEIEHLKITRFQAKRENYSIKTSLSWRLTWPLRVLRDAGAAFVHKSRARFGLFSSRGPSSWASRTTRVPRRASRPGIDARSGIWEQQAAIDRQSIELFTEGLRAWTEKGRQPFSSLMRSRGPAPPSWLST